MAALTATIEPVILFNQTGTTLGCDVLFYDLSGVFCQVGWWLLNENESQIYWSRWQVPQDVLDVWGSNDNIIIESLAVAQGFTIISIP